MATEAQVRAVLRDPLAGGRVWTIQGLGMLRTYLDPEEVERLHIWDTGAAVPDVSTIHDHPWDFESRIVSGQVVNQRFDVLDAARPNMVAMPFYRARIRCGEGGGLVSEPDPVLVLAHAPEEMGPGAGYSQEAAEVHESFPDRGAVTVIRRTFRTDRDHATVLWQHGDWVSAEPRLATPAEVMGFVQVARAAWTGDRHWSQ